MNKKESTLVSRGPEASDGERPSISIRTDVLSTQQQTSNTSKTDRPAKAGMLTPPSSPPQRVGPSADSTVDYESLDTLRSSVDTERTFKYTNDGIISCPYEVVYIKDQNEKRQMFGYGAWSNVYKAKCHISAPLSNGVMTPPSASVPTPPLLVAVKSPARKDGVAIIRNEAQTLSRLRLLDLNEEYVVTFHGIIDQESALVLTAFPLSLEGHIRACAKVKAAQTSTASNYSTSPVIGTARLWLNLAEKLITALDWMHNEAAMIHGDIKPGNIVLRPKSDLNDAENIFSYDPLFIDFSSSQRLDVDDVTPNTLSAVTMEYTAPELLTSAVMKNPKSCATTASDVFSLAVTLLVAATGDPMVYTGCSSMQRQMLATQGHGVLSNIRSFSNKVPRHGVVDRVLERAVLKKDMGRISAGTWKVLLGNLKKDLEGQHKL
ncbi:hypothetical protein LTS08_008256 [Lithohypha guttulata]|uniref:Protein kinase domain-containing protein n=1 Tax=Lithohypha guttulata TaxID=1690604 RepID=A0AAN7YHZ4_9EURO|nr:hypothetical protein LTR05_004018 [Lithohypha guttulata]KAK5095096.1 hypothetical protein LTS08_008256 [Lithohypha guttulata]